MVERWWPRPVVRAGAEKVRLSVLLILPHLRYIFLESLGGNDPKQLSHYTKTTFLGVVRESAWSSTPAVSRKVYLKWTLSVSTVHKKKQTITVVDQLGPRSGTELKELAKALERHCRAKARVVQTGGERSIRLSGNVGVAAKAFLVRHWGLPAEQLPRNRPRSKSQ